jgi:hypothetical protein
MANVSFWLQVRLRQHRRQGVFHHLITTITTNACLPCDQISSLPCDYEGDFVDDPFHIIRSPVSNFQELLCWKPETNDLKVTCFSKTEAN